MKGFLFDENLPQRIRFTPSQPVVHVETLGASLEDAAVWEFARQGELVIVTKDADFSDRILLSQPPPWLVHLRIGNLRRADFHAFLARIWPPPKSRKASEPTARRPRNPRWSPGRLQTDAHSPDKSSSGKRSVPVGYALDRGLQCRPVIFTQRDNPRQSRQAARF